jgi:hypothetical protein
MSLATARRFLPWLVLVLAILVPYHRLTTMQGIIVTDDRIISDVFGAELPGRVEAGRLLRAGEWPTWTPRLCTGYPLLAGGVFPDPLTSSTFALLPPAAALNVFVLTTLIVAALGTYALARRLGASAAGATLSGLAFSWSGYMVCQLKHLGIVATVCWLPLGLFLLDRALDKGETATLVRRAYRLVPFAALVAVQWMSNFPQSAYICTLCYGAFALAHAIPQKRFGAKLLVATGVITALGMLCAAMAVLPMQELGTLSDRKGGVVFEFATMLPYSPKDILTFFVPYANGDISDLTYTGSGLFWENYGYVGFATACLAIFAVVRGYRKFHVAFFALTALVAYLIVLGPATPFFKLVFYVLPGMRQFRFPTRFMVLVDLALSILAGIGLTRLEETLQTRKPEWARAVVVAIVAITGIDLVFHQLRQNPIADAKQWLAKPASAQFLAQEKGHFRVFTPKHREAHMLAWQAARGWKDITPYFVHRELLQPNTNLFWGLDTCDCYAGLLPASTQQVWGEYGLIQKTHKVENGELLVSTALFKLLALSANRYLLTPWQLSNESAKLVAEAPPAHIYRVPALPRAWVARSAVKVDGPTAAVNQLLAPDFDLDSRIVVEGAESMTAPSSSGPREGHVVFVADQPKEIVLDVTSKEGGWLLLADTFYPGWHAELDGVEVPIVRANGRHRAIVLPPGPHRVRQWFRSGSAQRGLYVSFAAIACLVVLGVVLGRVSRVLDSPS